MVKNPNKWEHKEKGCEEEEGCEYGMGDDVNSSVDLSNVSTG